MRSFIRVKDVGGFKGPKPSRQPAYADVVKTKQQYTRTLTPLAQIEDGAWFMELYLAELEAPQLQILLRPLLGW